MAVPKCKTSKARKAKRRASWKLEKPNLIECPQCHTLRVSHRVCKECGVYNGKEVLKVKEA